MKYTKTASGGSVEILAADWHVSLPKKIVGSGVVKAGSPITEAGGVGTAATAVGVLLYDVNVDENPNAAIVVKGVIDATKAKAHSGIDLTGIEDSVPGIVLRTDTGVNA